MTSEMLTEETEVPRFYSVNQISPYIMRISDGLISNVKQYASYELDVMSLQLFRRAFVPTSVIASSSERLS